MCTSNAGRFEEAAAAERENFLDAVAKAGLPKSAAPEQVEREPTMRRLPECNTERKKPAASRT